jgi:hypothetical protein
MIVGGVVLIRRAEVGSKKKRGPVIDEDDESASDIEHLHDNIANFDLLQFNWIGWLLLTGTLAFAILLIIIVIQLTGGFSRNTGGKAISILVLLFAVGFFFAARWILSSLGVRIIREASEDRRTRNARTVKPRQRRNLDDL